MNEFPERSEAAEYYFGYIDQVAPGDILERLEIQGAEIARALEGISDERSLHRYAPGKWSIRDLVKHISDAERLFAFRAFWFARGFAAPLPSFEEDPAAIAACADSRTWSSTRLEFASVRAATLSLFRTLPDDAWSRRGTASGYPFTVRALAFIAVGHATHHMNVLHARYLPS